MIILNYHLRHQNRHDDINSRISILGNNTECIDQSTYAEVIIVHAFITFNFIRQFSLNFYALCTKKKTPYKIVQHKRQIIE